MDKNIEQLAAERILESGVRVKLPAPLFLRIFGKKTISPVLKAPFRGGLFYISKLSLKAGFDFAGIDEGGLDEVHKLVIQHTKTMSLILAVAFLRARWAIKLFLRPVAFWFTWNTTNRKTAEIIMTLSILSSPQDFTNSIRLIRSMKITAPKNLSPMKKGSNEDEQPDSIAPGESSGV